MFLRFWALGFGFGSYIGHNFKGPQGLYTVGLRFWELGFKVEDLGLMGNMYVSRVLDYRRIDVAHCAFSNACACLHIGTHEGSCG